MVHLLFPNGERILQDNNAPMYTVHVVKNWNKEHESELEHMEWTPQSPNSNSIQHLLCVSER